MKASDFIKQLKFAASKKTLYVMGAFGASLNDKGKKRYKNNNDYNRNPVRQKMIDAADANTFAFDCVGLLQGIIGGWRADTNPALNHGGAAISSYFSSTGANAFAKTCKDLTTDFSHIDPGEIVWKDGHIGAYIGDGLCIECTPSWKNGVQYTSLGNIGTVKGYPTRTWTHHGHLTNWIEYDKGITFDTFKAAAKKDGVTLNDWNDLPVIQKGSKYKNLVKVVQEIVGTTADGAFGANTTAAVKAWQKANGQKVNGLFWINNAKHACGEG